MKRKSGGRSSVQAVRKRSANRKKPKTGFTIIEVLIVLAIAGLILTILFLVVPTANRNARNHERKEAVNYIASEMETYYTNNSQYPLFGAAAPDNRTAFRDSLKSAGLAAGYDIRYVDNGASHEYPFKGAGAPSDWRQAYDEISIEPGHVCNTSAGLVPYDTDYPLRSSTGSDTNYKAYAIWTLLEKAPLYCVDGGAK